MNVVFIVRLLCINSLSWFVAIQQVLAMEHFVTAWMQACEARVLMTEVVPPVLMRQLGARSKRFAVRLSIDCLT